jgi:hypothetical protein
VSIEVALVEGVETVTVQVTDDPETVAVGAAAEEPFCFTKKVYVYVPTLENWTALNETTERTLVLAVVVAVSPHPSTVLIDIQGAAPAAAGERPTVLVDAPANVPKVSAVAVCRAWIAGHDAPAGASQP